MSVHDVCTLYALMQGVRYVLCIYFVVFDRATSSDVLRDDSYSIHGLLDPVGIAKLPGGKPGGPRGTVEVLLVATVASVRRTRHQSWTVRRTVHLTQHDTGVTGRQW